MSQRDRLWQRVERLLELVRLQRARVTQLGGDCESAWAIARHAAEIEAEARALAVDAGCDSHLRVM